MIDETSREAVKDIPGISVTTRRYSLARPPVETSLSSPSAEALKESYREIMGRKISIKSFPAYTDAAMAQAYAEISDSMVFGPGELEDAHTVDESVDIAQLTAAPQILYGALSKLLFLPQQCP
jgi:succinyl-diaminopimelate desuccinylase